MAKNIIKQYYGNDRASKVVYGTILIFSYLISQNHHTDTATIQLVLGTFFASVAIMVAEVYAEIIGKTIKQKKPLTKSQRLEIEKDSLAIIGVSIWPSFVFLLSYIGLFSAQVAFNINYVILISNLILFSYWASRLSSLSIKRSVVTSLIVASVGIVVIFIKYYFGH